MVKVMIGEQPARVKFLSQNTHNAIPSCQKASRRILSRYSRDWPPAKQRGIEGNCGNNNWAHRTCQFFPVWPTIIGGCEYAA